MRTADVKEAGRGFWAAHLAPRLERAAIVRRWRSLVANRRRLHAARPTLFAPIQSGQQKFDPGRGSRFRATRAHQTHLAAAAPAKARWLAGWVA